ncbi:MAG: L-histidine N(alpha)-methyltransferase [Solirubrobacteraceae bacterium]
MNTLSPVAGPPPTPATPPRLASGAVHQMVRPAAAVAREIREAVRAGTIIPAHLFYEARGGAGNWTLLTADSTYASATDSASLFHTDAGGIGGAIAALTGGRPICAISLGPGSGWKEEVVLEAIIETPGAAATVRYHALDASPILAVEALTRILVNDALAAAAVAASAVVARFTDLPALRPIYAADEAANLVMLLGNTLGNLADERGLLRMLHAHAMKEDDLLLLEVTLAKPETDEIAALGELASIRRFNFAPLAAVGVPYRPENLTYRMAAGRSTIPGTRTVVAAYRELELEDEVIPAAEIAYVHRYEAAAVVELLARTGFDLCRAPWFGPGRRSMLVLAQRG